MEPIFISQDLWDIVQDGYESPQEDDEDSKKRSGKQTKEYKENAKQNASALRIIQQAVSKSIYPRIYGIKKAKEAWDVLREQVQGSEKAISIRRQSLWLQFDNLMMKETDTIKDFHSRVTETVNQIKATGDVMEERKVVERILRSLSSKFEHIVAVIEETKDLANLSMSELMGSLVAHEQRMSRFTKPPLEQAFSSKVNMTESKYAKSEQGRRGGNSQWRGRGRSNYSGNKRQNYQQQKLGYTGSSCIICKKAGHATKDCRYKCKIQNHSQRDCWFQNKQEEGESSGTKNEESNMVVLSCLNGEQKLQLPWMVDSGCSNHMNGDVESFADIDDQYRSQVKLGDGKKLKVEGKGTVVVCTEEGNNTLIRDFLYVSELTLNLLSVGQLMLKNYKLLFDNGVCESINKTGNFMVVKFLMTSNRIFSLAMSQNGEVAFKSENLDQSFLWHLRYGHLNFKGLKLSRQKNMVAGLP
ncbi:unnamed protein product [Linum trigynum]|uniref:CCHC-type domain-containing protein n=2 Tax=Linum trigynum TaxID=586398 RepID=A0AAV2DTT6_9ROSI